MAFKKVMSAVMAGAMVLSMGMTAFATSTNAIDLEGEEGYEIEIGSSTQVATIKVQVPEVVGFIVNPYRLDAKNDELGITNAGQTQIVSPLQKIVNKSDFNIEVGGTIHAYENNPEEAKLVASIATTAPSTGFVKEAKIHFLAKAGTAADTTALTTSGTNDVNVDLSTAKTDAGAALTAVELDDKDGTNPAYTFNFDGEAQAAPAVSWTDGDTFGANIVFTFTAVANAAGGGSTTAASVSLDNTTLTVASGSTGTLTATFNAGSSGKTVTKYDWASDNTSVATVTAGGSASDTSTTITNVSAGSANVTVTVTLDDNSTVTATCTVTCS